MSAQQKLLNWCKAQTNGYAGVNIENFHLSWRDGLGLLVAFYPLIFFNYFSFLRVGSFFGT